MRFTLEPNSTRAPWIPLVAALLLAACSEAELPSAPLRELRPQADIASIPADLFFSEYIEGSSNNKALEIYNGTAAPVDLEADAYNVQMFFNGSSSAGLTINLAGTVASGDVFVLAHSSAAAAILAQADLTNGAGWFNGDDAVVLRRGSVVLDVIGQVGFDPGSEWGSALQSTADNTLRRRSSECQGDPNGSAAFDPALAWDGLPTDTFDGLGSHSASCGEAAPRVTGVTPDTAAAGVPVNAQIAVTFSEPVDVSGDWFTISCSSSGMHSAAASGGPTTFALDPSTNFASNETCTVTIHAHAVADRDAVDPPDHMEADYSWSFRTVDLAACLLAFTPIPEIQGVDLSTPLAGQTVTTQGVVVGDYEGASPTLRGFYLQDPRGDRRATTSDGIFVFNGNNDHVNVGDIVRVTGRAEEFQDQTQLGGAVTVTVCGSGGTVTPVNVSLPFPSADFAERFEGMLVRLPQTLFVTEHFQLGRFGQVVLSSGARLVQPTAVVSPGPQALARQLANDLNRIILDDTRNDQNPDPIVFGGAASPLTAMNTLRGGYTTSGIVGVMTYTWAGNAASGNAYRIRPGNALGAVQPSFVPANPRPASPPSVGGTLRVAALNLLNYFNTFGTTSCANGVGGPATECRGAENAAEFERQWRKTVPAITTLNADVLGVIEIENDGYGPQSAIADLVNRLNAATSAGRFAFIDVDAATSQPNALGTDAIKVGLIYQPARVTPVGTTAVLNSVAFVNGGDGGPRNRPALAQAFQQSDGARFIVDVNHFKSKGSACDAPDAGDGQGNCAIVRKIAAQELLAWLATDPTRTAEPDILILGDLNSYARESSIQTLTRGGFTDLIARQGGYSYVFDGQWGYLDYALASSSILPRVSGVAEWHINADEPSVLDYNTNFKSPAQLVSLFAADPFRMADHDPVLTGLALQGPPVRFAFTGFLAPVLNLPAENTVVAGQMVPVRFSLGGNRGSNIFDAGFPRVVQTACAGSGGPVAAAERINTGSLSYDAASDTYTYAWRTPRAWVGTCRELVLRFSDETVQHARFRFVLE